jgi:hypothetical protein
MIMKKFLVFSAGIIALSGSIFADTIVGTGTFSAMPIFSAFSTTTGTSSTEGSPFWNNNSGDGSQKNVGYLLTESGVAFGSTNVLGSGSVSNEYTAAGGADPTSFSFVRDTTAYNVSLLYANSSLNYQTSAPTTTVGIYDATTGMSYSLYSNAQTSSAATVGPTGVEAFPGIATSDVYDVYATVCYSQAGGPTLCNTYNSNTSLSSGAATSGLTLPTSLGGGAWNHFALFQLAGNGGYVIAFEDGNSTLNGEQEGDFNDLVIKFGTSALVPEPGTVGIIGLGLAGLGFLGRRRLLKK